MLLRLPEKAFRPGRFSFPLLHVDTEHNFPEVIESRDRRSGGDRQDHRQCHEDRIHTVIVVDADAQPLRVSCDFCRSEHNYRGGARLAPPARPVPGRR